MTKAETTAILPTTEEAAKIAADRLKVWKAMRESYKEVHEYANSVLQCKEPCDNPQLIWEAEESLAQSSHKYGETLAGYMAAFVFGCDAIDCKYWMFNEYDALLSDLEDIARGDY